MESQIYYRPANHETAEYLERTLGRVSQYARSHTLHEGRETSEGLSEQAVPLMAAQQIKQLRDEEILGFHRRLPPFRAKRMDWRDFPLLTKRQRIPPPAPAVLPRLAENLPAAPWRRGGTWTAAYVDPDRVN